MHHFLKFASKFCLNNFTFTNNVIHNYCPIHHIGKFIFDLETKRRDLTNFPLS